MLSIKHEPSHSDDIFIHNYFHFQKAGTISLSSPIDKNHLKFSHFLLKKSQCAIYDYCSKRQDEKYLELFVNPQINIYINL